MFDILAKMQNADPKGTKFLDWEKAKQICNENPYATIFAGLEEDWGWTSEIIFHMGKFVKTDNEHGSLFVSSFWATPVLAVDGNIIDCWKYEKDLPKKEQTYDRRPDWWGKK